MNHSMFAWRRILTSFSVSTIQKDSILTDTNRPKVLIIDDSMFDRNRSKKVELLARCLDHSSLTKRFYKEFRMLAMGWSDDFTFMPLDFTLLSSKNLQINGISDEIDKRICGFNRRMEALETAPSIIPEMIERALKAGVTADYVLMDTWFTQQPLIKSIVEIGLDVIGIIKATNQRYLVNDNRLSLKELYSYATPVQGKKGILRSI